MTDEVCNLHDIKALGLIGLGELEKTRTFNPLHRVDANNIGYTVSGRETQVPYPITFVLLPRGKHLRKEVVEHVAITVLGTIALTFIGSVLAKLVP